MASTLIPMADQYRMVWGGPYIRTNAYDPLFQWDVGLEKTDDGWIVEVRKLRAKVLCPATGKTYTPRELKEAIAQRENTFKTGGKGHGGDDHRNQVVLGALRDLWDTTEMREVLGRVYLEKETYSVSIEASIEDVLKPFIS